MSSSSTEDECGILFTIGGDININSVRWYGRLKPQDSPGWLSLSEFKKDLSNDGAAKCSSLCDTS